MATPKYAYQRRLYKTRWTVKKISHQRSNQETFVPRSIYLVLFWFPQNTPKTHSVFPHFGGKGGEGGRETTRENEATVFWGNKTTRRERDAMTPPALEQRRRRARSRRRVGEGRRCVREQRGKIEKRIGREGLHNRVEGGRLVVE